MINSAMSDTNDPRLGIGVTFKEPISCRHNVFIDFKLSSFNVDRYNLTFITGFDLLPNARFVEFLPSLG
jgi:hypothetical protein